MRDRARPEGAALIGWLAGAYLIGLGSIAFGWAFGLAAAFAFYIVAWAVITLAVILLDLAHTRRVRLLLGSSAERGPKRAAPPCTSAGFNSEREP